jgi:hypothetical protein
MSLNNIKSGLRAERFVASLLALTTFAGIPGTAYLILTSVYGSRIKGKGEVVFCLFLRLPATADNMAQKTIVQTLRAFFVP